MSRDPNFSIYLGMTTSKACSVILWDDVPPVFPPRFMGSEREFSQELGVDRLEFDPVGELGPGRQRAISKQPDGDLSAEDLAYFETLKPRWVNRIFRYL